MSGDVVRSQAAHAGGDACGYEFLEGHLREAGGRTSFTATAKEVHVEVNEPRDQRTFLAVQDFLHPRRFFQSFPNQNDLSRYDEEILDP
jgi:hypothetical protein